MGLYTQQDPIGIAGGLNLYGYAGGDPINFSDPFGLCPDIWCVFRSITRRVLGSLGTSPEEVETSAERVMEALPDVEVSGTVGNSTVACGGDGCGSSLEVAPPQIGGSVNIVFGEQGSIPVSVNVGLNRHLGVSFFDGGMAVNIGSAIGGSTVSGSVDVSALLPEQVPFDPNLLVQPDATRVGRR